MLGVSVPKAAPKIATPKMVLEDIENASQDILDLVAKIKQPTAEEVANYEFLVRNNLKSTENVKEYTETYLENRDIVQAADYVRTYSKHYPQNKFLIREQIMDICKKYGLFHAALYRFRGRIPDQNLKELREFTYKDDYSLGGFTGREAPPEGQALSVIAKKEDLTLNLTDVVSEYRIESRDPIILRVVPGGYLVVTAWGDEAKDATSERRN